MTPREWAESTAPREMMAMLGETSWRWTPRIRRLMSSLDGRDHVDIGTMGADIAYKWSVRMVEDESGLEAADLPDELGNEDIERMDWRPILRVQYGGHYHRDYEVGEFLGSIHEIVGDPFRAVECKTCHGCGRVERRTRDVITGDLELDNGGPPCPDCKWDSIRSWQGGEVVNLAKQVYGKGRDWYLLPIIADALTDAGCEDQRLIDHLRLPIETHKVGCWALDTVLDLYQGRAKQWGPGN